MVGGWVGGWYVTKDLGLCLLRADRSWGSKIQPLYPLSHQQQTHKGLASGDVCELWSGSPKEIAKNYILFLQIFNTKIKFVFHENPSLTKFSRKDALEIRYSQLGAKIMEHQKVINK